MSAAIVASFFPTLAGPLVAGVFSLVGLPAIYRLYVSLIRSDEKLAVLLDVHSLMTLSALAALVIGQGPEGAFLLALFQLAHAIQHRIVIRAKKDVKRLADLVPDSVQLSSGELVPITKVGIGTRVLVKPGCVCPIDGRLVQPASASVQLSHLTGESVPVEKRVHELIPAGCVNLLSTPIQIETTAMARESTLQRIVELAESAAKSRPRVASLISETVPAYSSAVLAGTASIALCGPLLLNWPIYLSVYKALSFLVAASPCALLVASPVAQAAAVSACSRRGIVVSGGAQAFERFATAESIALDKTGTLTEGRMHIVAVESVKGDSALCVRLGAVLGRFGSTHPVSQGIGRELRDSKHLRLVPMTVEETVGMRVSGSVFDADLTREWFVSISKYGGGDARGGRSMSRISVVSLGEEHECIVSLEDKVRAGVADSVKKSKLPIYILTGDNTASALAVASNIGLPHSQVFSELVPEMKTDLVSRTLPNPVMVGDGINDAPALAAARAGGVAVTSTLGGQGIQSAAVSVCDAVVITEEGSASNPVEAVSFLIAKSIETNSLINTNVGIAILGMVGTALAVLVGNCPLWLAVLVHEGSTVLVVINSLRNL